MDDRLERNKRNVQAFYDLMFNQCRPREAIERYAGASYTQRSIPTDCLALGKGVPVTDESGQAMGHFSGVVMGSERRIEQILVDNVAAPAIFIDQLMSCTEDGLRVRQIATP